MYHFFERVTSVGLNSLYVKYKNQPEDSYKCIRLIVCGPHLIVCNRNKKFYTKASGGQKVNLVKFCIKNNISWSDYLSKINYK